MNTKEAQVLDNTLRARKAVLAAAIVALAAATVPPLNAEAQAMLDPGNPPAANEQRGWRLERAWARQQWLHDRLSYMFDHTQQRIDRAQDFIDRAEANGKDTSAIQAALDAFANAISEARPIFESAKGLVSAHRGFDDSGRVTDASLAAETVQSMAEKLREIRDVLLDPTRGMRDAIRAFWEANRPD
jgi:hypothetical protein